MAFKVLIKDRIYVPKEVLTEEEVEDRYSVQIFKEKNCKKCDNLEERLALGGPNDLCLECPSFIADYKLWKETDTHWILPQGDELPIRKVMENKGIRVVDKRPEYPFKENIKFIAPLFGKDYVDKDGFPRPNQRRLVRKFHEAGGSGILECRPRSGKCIVGNSMVMTSNGFLSMEELSSENLEFTPANFSITTHKGNRKVSHTYRSKSKTIKLLTQQGFELEGTPEHPILTLSKNLTFEWKNISDIKVGEYVVSNHNDVEPLWGASNLISKDLARILGWLTANGCYESFSSSNQKVITKFKRSCQKEFGRTPVSKFDRIRVESHKISRYDYKPLAKLGYSPKNAADKEIPLEIRKSPKAIISAYLNAYFECDSGRDGSSIIICSASSKLIYQIQNLLLMGFGILSVRSSRKNFARNSNNPTIKKYYQLSIHGNDSYKFCKEFPSAKVVKEYTKLTLTDSTQSWQHNHIPYAAKLISESAKSKFIKAKSSGAWSNAYKMEDGSIKKYQFHASIRREKNQIGMATWNCQKFQEDLAFIAEMDKSLSKKLNFINRKEIKFLKITKKIVGKKKDVFDLSVPGVKAYYSNGIVCHNTAMGLKIAIDLGLRTVVLAHKKALLRQFYRTLTAKKTNQRPIQFTNIPDLPNRPAKEPIVLWAQTRAQLKRYKTADFLLVNYQKFVRKPEELAKIIDGNFSTVIVDECHNSGAEGYLRVIARCNIKHRIALSATPRRKDGRHKLINLTLGPVVAKSKSVSLIPRITFIQSKAMPKTAYKSWPHAISFIFNSKQRNEEIVNKVIADMKSGHKTVLIPVDHLKHQLALQKMFNDRKKDLAVIWNEKSNEEEVLKRVDSDRFTVLIAIRSMIREGVDMLRPSCIHIVVPMSAESEDGVGAPMFDQLVNRVCTPFGDKPDPLVRIWVDNVGMFQGTLKSLFFHEIWPNRYNPSKKIGKYWVKSHLKDVISSIGKLKPTSKRGWV